MNLRGILILTALLAGVLQWLWSLWRGRWPLLAENWESAEGEVVRTGMSLLRHAVRIRYRYFADNHYRNGYCDVDLNDVGRSWPNDPRIEENVETVAEMKQTYVPGMKITVRYDPEHPSRSVLWY